MCCDPLKQRIENSNRGVAHAETAPETRTHNTLLRFKVSNRKQEKTKANHFGVIFYSQFELFHSMRDDE